MQSKRNYLTLLPALFFVLLLFAGLAVACITLRQLSAKDWRELSDPAKLLSGESTKRFTHLLNQNFVLGHTFSRIEHGILWNLTGDLGPRVRAGCGNWLFLTDELEIHRDRAANAQFRASLAARLDNRLQARGIKLLMVVVPDKTRIESEHLCGLHRPQPFDQRIADWLAELNSRGIETLDLTATLADLSGERYYHTDTHWNETGAHAAAAAIAAKLRRLQWAEAAAQPVTLSNRPVERPGDLIHLAGLDDLPALLRPKTELTPVTQVPAIATSGDDLFGDANLPTVALVGTSYSRNSNFAPFLEHQLGEQVANLAKDGGDFAGAATAYFGGTTFRDTPPRLVVWEIPERVIEMPVKDVERSWLQQLDSGAL